MITEILFPKSLNINSTKEIAKYVNSRVKLGPDEIKHLEQSFLKCTLNGHMVLDEAGAFYDSPKEGTDVNAFLKRVTSHLLAPAIERFQSHPNLDHTAAARRAIAEIELRNCNAIVQFLREHHDKIRWMEIAEEFVSSKDQPRMSAFTTLYSDSTPEVKERIRRHVLEKWSASNIRRFANEVKECQEILGEAAASRTSFKEVWVLLTGGEPSRYSYEEGGNKFDADDKVFAKAVELAGPRDLVLVYKRSGDAKVRSQIAKRALEQENLGTLSKFCQMVDDKMWDGKAKEQFTGRIRTLVQSGEVIVQMLSGDLDPESFMDYRAACMMMHPMMMHPMMMGGPFRRF